MIEDVAYLLRLRKGNRFVNKDSDVPIQPASKPDLTDLVESFSGNRRRWIYVDLNSTGVWFVGCDAAQRFHIARMDEHGRMVREVPLRGNGPQQAVDVVLSKVAVIAMAKR
jgi:hypothetical protein